MFKKTWLIISNSPLHFKGQAEKFEGLFRKSPDPWGFTNSLFEKTRFEIITGFVKSLQPENILELGCAEGLLTERLYSVCHDITAVEISKTALQKARLRVPRAKFILRDIAKLNLKKKFSLILAAEVLYYLTETEIQTFLKNNRADYLFTANSWNAFSKVEALIKRSGYRPVKDRWLFRFENLQPKASHICLWKNS